MPSIHALPRLTHDIIVRGRMASASECAAAVRPLARIVAAGGSTEALLVMSLEGAERDAYDALHACGALETVVGKPWDRVAVTAYGRAYFAQRS